MTDLAEYIKRTVNAAPPLSPEQRDRLALLLDPNPSGQVPPPMPEALDPPKRCALYRHYDADDVLLYVGIAFQPDQRQRDHVRSSDFTHFSVRHEASWYDTRADAEAAEREAIQSERPVFNRVHAALGADVRLFDYLVKHRAVHMLKLR